jgi:hypothetical protein
VLQCCAIENIGSFKVLEKAGMIREGHSRQLIPLKTGWSDCYEYAILAVDYKQQMMKPDEYEIDRIYRRNHFINCLLLNLTNKIKKTVYLFYLMC